jgi:hypothetical protein
MVIGFDRIELSRQGGFVRRRDFLEIAAATLAASGGFLRLKC